MRTAFSLKKSRFKNVSKFIFLWDPGFTRSNSVEFAEIGKLNKITKPCSRLSTVRG